MRWLLIVLLWTGVAQAQTRHVAPRDAELTVTIESEGKPYTQQMVMIRIHGVYRRHVTRETLEQPALEGFNWSQLGEDRWYDSYENGQKVKNFERRMALFPDEAGEVTIGPFVHHLTLTDEGDDWFDHDIRSEPVTFTVRPAPTDVDWWFPVRSLRISDDWSNAPDQLRPGEGVLRIIRIEAVGATPEMIPPMPELTSPSAMIFAHPEKRLVELSPQGPVTYAFWRWTVRPTNATSAILEPISFDYFDTEQEKAHRVTISAQRIAYEDATLVETAEDGTVPAGNLRRGPLALVAALGLLAGLVAMLAGRRLSGEAVWRSGPFDPLGRQVRRAARAGDLAALRRAGAALIRRDGPDPARRAILHRLDSTLFGGAERPRDLRALARAFLRGDAATG
ncbi:BatD family protein [Roseivivax sediminis]|uniref:Oxygen tolerance n=1 Tax=Roseivivax sediminis TaxID=936889 RepID=A0A1I1TWW9_9RHOB|nr:BatD family protein [Roseivivax sediminis]SFD63111.1 Oxygen tolerance [Roseivivax sediminis]